MIICKPVSEEFGEVIIKFRQRRRYESEMFGKNHLLHHINAARRVRYPASKRMNKHEDRGI